jgi:nitrogen-specific signal transduction histidine kinase
MDFVEAPVVVGDPDGRAVYLNPCFEASFGVSRAGATGQPLASLFEGGGREAVLRAVASVCARGETSRFHLREGEDGYSAIASPIVTDQGRVGVVILLTQEPANERRVTAFHRDVQEPLDDLTRCLAELAEQTGGRRSERYRQVLDDGARALGEIRKRADSLLDGRASRSAPGGPARSEP